MKQDHLYPDHIEFSRYTLFPEKNDYTEFELFLKFLRTAEPAIIDVFDFVPSIRNKFMAVSISCNEVLYQIPKWHAENEETRNRGFSSGIQRVLLAIKYETYLNSIYSLCENLSFLVTKFYLNKGLSNKFDKQKKQFLSDKQKLDESYSKILEKTDWYEEVHAIRSETTHFLTGLIIISDFNEPCYSYNQVYNPRKRALKQITIESIEYQMKSIQNDLVSFLNEYSEHFMNLKYNKDISVPEICLRTDEGKLGFRSITLNDYLNRKPRKCISLEFNCPHKEKCSLEKA